MEFPTLFTPLPWNFQHFVSIFNPFLGISSPKMLSSMEFSIWKKMSCPHGIFWFLDRRGADINWNSPMIFISYSYIIRLVRYLGDEIWIGHKKLLINYLLILVNVLLRSIGVHSSWLLHKIFRHVAIEISVYYSSWSSVNFSITSS